MQMQRNIKIHSSQLLIAMDKFKEMLSNLKQHNNILMVKLKV